MGDDRKMEGDVRESLKKLYSVLIQRLVMI